MLHDRDHSDFDAVRRNGNLGTHLRVSSFTDLLDEENPHNEGLRDAVFSEADFLLIQKRLLKPKTHAALIALNTSMISSVCQTEVGVFTDDYQVKMLSVTEIHDLLDETKDFEGGENMSVDNTGERFQPEDEINPELRTLLFITMLHNRTPELLKIGWSSMSLEQSAALNSMFRFAASVGAAYALAEAELGHPPSKVEMSEFFGLTLHEEHVPRADKGESS
ncbi:hypothetical protein KC973_01960 [Candidatus Saccharibacteria bacterium]|nr:hypothetical protein [Candidatus Saccharibacteria bacterium]